MDVWSQGDTEPQEIRRTADGVDMQFALDFGLEHDGGAIIGNKRGTIWRVRYDGDEKAARQLEARFDAAFTKPERDALAGVAAKEPEEVLPPPNTKVHDVGALDYLRNPEVALILLGGFGALIVFRLVRARRRKSHGSA